MIAMGRRSITFDLSRSWGRSYNTLAWTNYMNQIPYLPWEEKVIVVDHMITKKSSLLFPEQMSVPWMKDHVCKFSRPRVLVIGLFSEMFYMSKRAWWPCIIAVLLGVEWIGITLINLSKRWEDVENTRFESSSWRLWEWGGHGRVQSGDAGCWWCIDLSGHKALELERWGFERVAWTFVRLIYTETIPHSSRTRLLQYRPLKTLR